MKEEEVASESKPQIDFFFHELANDVWMCRSSSGRTSFLKTKPPSRWTSFNGPQGDRCGSSEHGERDDVIRLENKFSSDSRFFLTGRDAPANFPPIKIQIPKNDHEQLTRWDKLGTKFFYLTGQKVVNLHRKQFKWPLKTLHQSELSSF